jgi:hypothetical protein
MQEPDDSIDLRGTSFDWTRRELLAVTVVTSGALLGCFMPRENVSANCRSRRTNCSERAASRSRSRAPHDRGGRAAKTDAAILGQRGFTEAT